MADGQVIFDITGNNEPIKKSLSETTATIQKETKNWDQSVDDSSGTISSSLIGAFKAVTASAAFIKISQMLIQLGGESIQLASDLQEVQNVVDVTFGEEGSKQIEKWAKGATEQFGLTELQAKQYASTIGAMMKSGGMTEDQILDMSMSLAGLAADMASFYNLPFDEAFSKIQSGMAGMSMPLRQLGIDMTETTVSAWAMANGYETAFNKMSEQEQTMVRYQYLMSATADAQGDFARTSDSFANSQRRMATAFDTLKAQLGEALLPIATTVSNAVNDLLELLIYEPPETAFDVAAESMADAAGEAAKAQGILGYMDKLTEKYGEAATNTDEWAAALERLKEVMPGVNEFIDAETGALTATNEQLKAYVENRKQALIEEAKNNAIKQLNDEYTQAGIDYYTQEINRDIANEQSKEAALGVIDYIIASLRKAYAEQGIDESEAGEGTFDREAYVTALQNGSITMNELMNQAYRFANENGDDVTVLERFAQIYDEQKQAAEKAAEEMGVLSQKMQSLEADLAVASAALEKFAAAASAAASSAGGAGGGDGDGSDGGSGGSSDRSFRPRGSRAFIGGQRVQTAAEASLARQYGMQSPGLDYGTMGAAMWANAPNLGGNVYLDGRTVGKVISDMQGRSYRNLQRSGWQG